ncbi:MAG: indole-3-glycerol phosphate synthase TrpC [bacterium]
MGAEGGGDYLDRKAASVRALRSTQAPSGAELERLMSEALGAPEPPSFAAALREGPGVAVIAEFKRRSPSGGSLVEGEDPLTVAGQYAEGGAACLSVLTDAEDFGGSLGDLTRVTDGVGLPVLRKDFITDGAAVWEARAAGAAAVLLIVGMLDGGELRSLLRAADGAGLDAVVEVHDTRECDRALEAGARIVGVNNRDLRSLTTDLAVTEEVAPGVPGEVTLVSESGIRTPEDVSRVRDAGADAVLVGEALMRLDPAARRQRVRALGSVVR